MKTAIYFLMALLPFSAGADELDTLLDSDADFKITVKEFRNAINAKSKDYLIAYDYKDNSGNTIPNEELKCVVKQVRIFNQVNWKKFRGSEAKAEQTIIYLQTAHENPEISSEFIHQADLGPNSLRLERLWLTHINFKGNCETFSKEEIEKAIDERFQKKKVRVASEYEGKLKREKLLDLLRQVSTGQPQFANNSSSGECSAPEVLCAKDVAAKAEEYQSAAAPEAAYIGSAAEAAL